jgi:hypothetical protein
MPTFFQTIYKIFVVLVFYKNESLCEYKTNVRQRERGRESKEKIDKQKHAKIALKKNRREKMRNDNCVKFISP